MMDNNGRPLSRKQTVRLMVALTILAWATQTLFKQWGYGAEPPETNANVQPEAAEKFVPANQLYPTGATMELRAEATVVGGEVKLRQICHWSDRDRSFFEPIGDLILIRLGTKSPFKAIALQEVRGILRDAGVNTAAINFAGAASCTVNRSDVEYDEKNGLQKWIETKEAIQNTGQGIDPTTPESRTIAASPATNATEHESIRTLRSALVADLAGRINLAPEVLQVNFKSQDEKVLNIAEPLFKYAIDPIRAKSLGNVSWNVTINSGTEVGGSSKKITIQAEARAWQDQVLTARPLSFRQVIQADDLVHRRTLVDQIGDEPLMTTEQVVGQQTSRELKPGIVLTGKMIDPVQLVKTGQFVTITLEQGSVQIKSVARAMESGSFGQTIRVKNEATREVFQVVLTGPQSGTMNLATPIISASSN